MRRAILAVSLSLALGVVVAAQAPSEDEAGVRAAVEHYLQGHATGDPEHFRKAFHPEAKLFWIKDGQLMQRTSAEFIAGAAGKPAEDEAQRKRRIVSIDVTGNAAVAKLELDYPKVRFIDYLSLLKTGPEWQIINKTFYAEPKSP